MIPRAPWLERRFESGLPLSVVPTVLERLRGTPARVEDRLRGVAASVLTVRADKSWSIQENVGHLLMAEELWAVRLDDFEARRSELRAARFESGRVEKAGFNTRPIEQLCADFRLARGSLVGRLERFDDDVFEVVARHPRLNQPMRIVDLMVFIAEHDDHHLARITELLRSAPAAAVGGAAVQ